MLAIHSPSLYQFAIFPTINFIFTFLIFPLLYFPTSALLLPLPSPLPRYTHTPAEFPFPRQQNNTRILLLLLYYDSCYSAVFGRQIVSSSPPEACELVRAEVWERGHQTNRRRQANRSPTDDLSFYVLLKPTSPSPTSPTTSTTNTLPAKSFHPFAYSASPQPFASACYFYFRG